MEIYGKDRLPGYTGQTLSGDKSCLSSYSETHL